MLRLLAFLCIVACSTPALAVDATSTWKTILKKCAKSDLIGRQQLFFGLSNATGPGSVWTFADDRSIRLQFELSDAFPQASDRERLVVFNPVVGCSGDSTTKWSLKLGLPFSSSATPISADIAAVLSRAKRVTVSVTGYSIDVLKGTPWKDAFNRLPEDNAYRAELYEPGRVLAANSVKVAGLKAVFTFKTALDANVQAQFKGKSFLLGQATAAGTAAALGTAVLASNSPAPPVASTTPSTSTPPTNDPCTMQPVADATPGTAANSDVRLSGSVTVHAQVVNANQIVMCASGPSYLLSAYSRIKNGATLGIGASFVGSPRVDLVDAKIPNGTRAVP